MAIHQHIKTGSRTDMLKLASYLARAIDTCFLHDPRRRPTISILGPMGCGKSLFVEAMMKTWADSYPLRDAVTIPYDNKMFLESEPCSAAMRTAYTDMNVAGRSARLAFNSDHIVFQEELDIATLRGFENTDGGGALFLSNDQRLPSDKMDMMPWVEIDIGSLLPSRGGDERMVRIEVFSDVLKNNARFTAYWTSLPDYRERAGLKKICDGNVVGNRAPVPV